MSYKVRKIDNRNALYPNMKYQICWHKDDFGKYYEVFHWCWATWGKSADYAFFNQIQALTPYSLKWSWRSISSTRSLYETFEIYLKTDEELSLFTLRWSAQ